MGMRKSKVMLQFAVDKKVALKFKEVVKVIDIPQGDLFTIMFAEFLKSCNGEKENKEDAKSEKN